MLPSLLYDLQSIQVTTINPWNTYNRLWSVYHNSNCSDSTAFGISLSLYSFFPWIPHPAMVFHRNLLTTDIYSYFRSSLRLSILHQFNPHFILEALFFQSSLYIQTWLHYLIILKWPDVRTVFTSNKAIYKAKLLSIHLLVSYVLSKEIGTCLQFLWSSTLFLYQKSIPNGYQYVNCFVSFVPLLSLKSLLVFVPYNLSGVIILLFHTKYSKQLQDIIVDTVLRIHIYTQIDTQNSNAKIYSLEWWPISKIIYNKPVLGALSFRLTAVTKSPLIPKFSILLLKI